VNHISWDLRTVADLLKITRVHIVAGGLAAYSLGVLLAVQENTELNFGRVVLGYLVVFLCDLSTHYSNDYFDARLSQSNVQTKAFGGSQILLKHPELRPLSRSIAIMLTLLSVALSALSVLLYGVPTEFLIITIAANLLGWLYSAPPICLSSSGLGEIAIALGTGIGIPGAGYFVTKGRVDYLFLLMAIPFTMYGFILSLSLEIPDMESDVKARKNNLVVRGGRTFSFSIIAALSFLATATLLTYAKTIVTPIDLTVVTILSCIPLATGLAGLLKRPKKSEEANHLSAANIAALFLFNILIDLYLVLLLLV
jgi:1,4-dihydroxy-2-naphthoate octaprenyltransferase